MPTREQLHERWLTEFSYPFTRREDDPLYRKEYNLISMVNDFIGETFNDLAELERYVKSFQKKPRFILYAKQRSYLKRPIIIRENKKS